MSQRKKYCCPRTQNLPDIIFAYFFIGEREGLYFHPWGACLQDGQRKTRAPQTHRAKSGQTDPPGKGNLHEWREKRERASLGIGATWKRYATGAARRPGGTVSCSANSSVCDPTALCPFFLGTRFFLIFFCFQQTAFHKESSRAYTLSALSSVIDLPLQLMTLADPIQVIWNFEICSSTCQTMRSNNNAVYMKCAAARIWCLADASSKKYLAN